MYNLIWRYIGNYQAHEEEFDDLYLLNLRVVELLYTLSKDGRSFDVRVEYTARLD